MLHLKELGKRNKLSPNFQDEVKIKIIAKIITYKMAKQQKRLTKLKVHSLKR